MSETQAEQLLRFIRMEVLPLLLERSVPGGIEIMIRRLRLEYPDLDLFSRS